MKTTALILLLVISAITFGQSTHTESFHSKSLNEERTLRIHLPKSFDHKSNKTYNLVITLDGEYMFYAAIGNTELLSSKSIGTLPEVIVVGIDQNFETENGYYSRWVDCNYDRKTGLPEKKGVDFLAFISNELIPYLEEEYHTNNFRTIAGHSFTANYVNYFLTNRENLFQGFIAVSPYIPKTLEDTLMNTLKNLETPSFYYLCTGENDLSGHKELITRLDSTSFSKINNPNFHYSFDNFDGESHMSLVSRSLYNAFKAVYSDYSPIDEAELERLLTSNQDLLEYLENKYRNIKTIYNEELTIREDDLFYISYVAESNEDWNELKKVGEFTVSIYPESTYGYYMIATAEENNNNLEKALSFYKKGYEKLSDETTNKSDFYEPIERIEALIQKGK